MVALFSPVVGCSFFSSVRHDLAFGAECVCLAPRAPNSHHLCSGRPWFRQGLGCLDELLARPRADPRVRLRMLTHALLLSTHLRMLCVVCWTDQHHSPPLPGSACGSPCYQSLVTQALAFTSSSCSGKRLEHDCDRVPRLPLRASGVHSRRSSVVATLRSCRRCLWPCASWSVGTFRRRHSPID